MTLLTYNNANFTSEVLQSSKPVLVTFSATWCGPCKAAKINLEHISNDYKDVVDVGIVDIDNSSELAGTYKVRSVPTICLFHNGKIVEKLNGRATKQALASLIDNNIKTKE